MIILNKIFSRRMHINKSDNSRHAFPVGFRNTSSTSSGSHTEECSIYSQLLMLWLKLELASLVSFQFGAPAALPGTSICRANEEHLALSL